MLLLRITQKQHKLKITESKYPVSTQWVLDVVLIGSRFWHTILHLSMGTPQDYGMVHVEHDNFLQKSDLSRRQLEERILFMFMLEMISLVSATSQTTWPKECSSHCLEHVVNTRSLHMTGFKISRCLMILFCTYCMWKVWSQKQIK